MKERGLMFKADMVRAILAGRKTQTRRVMRFQPKVLPHFDPAIKKWVVDGEVVKPQPYAVGDRIYIKETYNTYLFNAIYRADGAGVLTKWKSSMFMPKALARIWLEVTEVRPQWLLDISGEDAAAEGCPHMSCTTFGSAREWYQNLWESINGPGSWEANPMVWVYTFKRITR